MRKYRLLFRAGTNAQSARSTRSATTRSSGVVESGVFESGVFESGSPTLGKLLSGGLLLAGSIMALGQPAMAQLDETQLVDTQQDAAQQVGTLVEPIFRIAHEGVAGQPTQVASRIALAKSNVPFDLTQLAGEHPLMPSLRMAQQSLQTIDSRVRDYNAIMMKQERIDGVLADKEVAFIKVRHQPFSVYMYFLGDNKGRECLYNSLSDGSKGKLVARECGIKKRLGKFTLDPEGPLAMRGQKYPIMKLGLRELTKELVSVASNDVKFGECDVRNGQGTMEGRPITWLEVVHPTPRANFRFYKAQVFIDNELRIPVRYNAYTWPKQPGGEPELEESYTYLKLNVNNGYTDADFDPNNPDYYK